MYDTYAASREATGGQSSWSPQEDEYAASIIVLSNPQRSATHRPIADKAMVPHCSSLPVSSLPSPAAAAAHAPQGASVSSRLKSLLSCAVGVVVRLDLLLP